jgi:hypothetical protein
MEVPPQKVLESVGAVNSHEPSLWWMNAVFNVSVPEAWPSVWSLITSPAFRDEGRCMFTTAEAVDEQLIVDGVIEMLPGVEELIFM